MLFKIHPVISGEKILYTLCIKLCHIIIVSAKCKKDFDITDTAKITRNPETIIIINRRYVVPLSFVPFQLASNRGIIQKLAFFHCYKILTKNSSVLRVNDGWLIIQQHYVSTRTTKMKNQRSTNPSNSVASKLVLRIILRFKKHTNCFL